MIHACLLMHVDVNTALRKTSSAVSTSRKDTQSFSVACLHATGTQLQLLTGAVVYATVGIPCAVSRKLVECCYHKAYYRRE